MDNNEPNIGNKNENPMMMCPHIGLEDDPATSLGYPSAWNFCHHAKPIAVAHLDHQRAYCLTAKHTICPLFLKSENSPMPAELQAQDIKPGRSNRAPWRAIAALTVLIALVAVVAWQGIARGFFSLPLQQGKITSTPTLTTSPASPTGAIDSATLTSTPIGGGALTSPTQPPTFTPTKIPSPTSTAQPVMKLALETPIGRDQEFMIHRVLEGESLDRLANKYGTTVAALQAVNYYLPSPLLINWTVVIPLGKIDVQGLPAFQPLMVTGGMTLEAYAQSITVDVSTLSYYNGILPSYQLSGGDWLLVPRQKINTVQPSPTATP